MPRGNAKKNVHFHIAFMFTTPDDTRLYRMAETTHRDVDVAERYAFGVLENSAVHYSMLGDTAIHVDQTQYLEEVEDAHNGSIMAEFTVDDPQGSGMSLVSRVIACDDSDPAVIENLMGVDDLDETMEAIGRVAEASFSMGDDDPEIGFIVIDPAPGYSPFPL